MRWGEARRIAEVFSRELIYGFHRGIDLGLDEARLEKLVIWSKRVSLSEGFACAFLMVLMSGVPVLLADPNGLEQAVRDSSMIYNILMFTSVFMVVSTLALTLQASRLLEPLLPAPLARRDVKKIVLCYLLGGLYPVLLVPAIYALIVAEKLTSPQAFPLILAYGYVDVLLGISASLALSNVLVEKASPRKLTTRLVRLFWNGIYILAMLLVGILYELYLYISDLLEILSAITRGTGNWAYFIYPFSTAEAALASHDPAGALYSIIVCSFYLLISYLAMDRALSSYVLKAAIPAYGEGPSGGFSRPRIWACSTPLNILVKDLKVVSRDPRASYIAFLPLFSLTSLLPLLAGASTVELGPQLYYTSMTLFLLGCLMSSLAPCQLLDYEGGRLWVLFSIGARRKDIALAKSLSSTTIYVSYALPIAISFSLLLGDPYLLIYALSSILISMASSLLSSMILLSEISVETRSIHISLLKGLGLLALSAVLAIPLEITMTFLHPTAGLRLPPAYAFLTLGLSAMEFSLVLVSSRLALRHG